MINGDINSGADVIRWETNLGRLIRRANNNASYTAIIINVRGFDKDDQFRSANLTSERVQRDAIINCDCKGAYIENSNM